jgi:hypothetical protein
MSKISPAGDIEWLNVQPKEQIEKVPKKGGFGIGSFIPIGKYFFVAIQLQIWWESPSARPFLCRLWLFGRKR